LDYLSAETALVGQERVLRVLQKAAVPNLGVAELRYVVLNNFRNFCNPERVKFGPFLAAIQVNPTYLQECIDIAIQMNDQETTRKLFDVLYLAADGN
jgi:sorbitol-specific phosphotransferase system component IIC